VTRLADLLDALNDRLGRTIAWLTALMVVATIIVVLLRYGLDMGAIVVQESVTYMHALVVTLGIACTLKDDGHVRVDILYSRMTPGRRDLVNLAGHVLFLLPVCILVIFSSWEYVANAWRVREGSPEVGGIPAVFLLKTLIPVMAVLLLVQGAAETMRIVLRARDRA
jgi:TRAP-type mannitol/chloroaromatic compound transport system permease small subunit